MPNQKAYDLAHAAVIGEEPSPMSDPGLAEASLEDMFADESVGGERPSMMTGREWMGQHYPQYVDRAWMPAQLNKSIKGEYDNYVATQKAIFDMQATRDRIGVARAEQQSLDRARGARVREGPTADTRKAMLETVTPGLEAYDSAPSPDKWLGLYRAVAMAAPSMPEADQKVWRSAMMGRAQLLKEQDVFEAEMDPSDRAVLLMARYGDHRRAAAAVTAAADQGWIEAAQKGELLEVMLSPAEKAEIFKRQERERAGLDVPQAGSGNLAVPRTGPASGLFEGDDLGLGRAAAETFRQTGRAVGDVAGRAAEGVLSGVGRGLAGVMQPGAEGTGVDNQAVAEALQPYVPDARKKGARASSPRIPAGAQDPGRQRRIKAIAAENAKATEPDAIVKILRPDGTVLTMTRSQLTRANIRNLTRRGYVIPGVKQTKESKAR